MEFRKDWLTSSRLRLFGYLRLATVVPVMIETTSSQMAADGTLYFHPLPEDGLVLFLVWTTHFGIRIFEVSQVWSIELGSISNHWDHDCKWLFHISHPLKVFHDVSVSQISLIWTSRYPLVNFHITTERSTIFQWVNPLFLWPFYHVQWVNPL